MQLVFIVDDDDDSLEAHVHWPQRRFRAPSCLDDVATLLRAELDDDDRRANCVSFGDLAALVLDAALQRRLATELVVVTRMRSLEHARTVAFALRVALRACKRACWQLDQHFDPRRVGVSIVAFDE